MTQAPKKLGSTISFLATEAVLPNERKMQRWVLCTPTASATQGQGLKAEDCSIWPRYSGFGNIPWAQTGQEQLLLPMDDTCPSVPRARRGLLQRKEGPAKAQGKMLEDCGGMQCWILNMGSRRDIFQDLIWLWHLGPRFYGKEPM